MVTLTRRQGKVEDLDLVVHAIIEAGAGVVEFMVKDVIPGMPVDKLVAAAVVDPDSPLHFSNAVVAEVDGGPAGVSLAYASERFGLPTELRVIVPKRRLDHLRSLFASKLEDSFYLHALWVDPTTRGMQVGRGLLDDTAERARKAGYKQLSLHVWADNEVALSLYEGFGFEPMATLPIGTTEQLDHKGGMILMRVAI